MSKYFSVPIVVQSQGNEVTAQGTIHFDPKVLSISNIAGTNVNPDVKVGGGAPQGTQVIVNTSGIANGDIGLVINFNGAGGAPPVKLKVGSRTVATLRFLVTGAAGTIVSPITWNDNVFVTKLGDEFGQSLPGTIVNGGLVISSVGSRVLSIPSSIVVI